MTTTERILALYEEGYDQMVNRVKYRVGGPVNAEDVVQEAFANALKYEASYDESVPIENWFSTILTNAAHDFLSQERMEGMTTHNEEEGTDTLDNLCFQQEMIGKVVEEIDKRESPEKDALRGFVLLGWKATEIAQYLPMTANHIRVLVHRFKEEMRQKYGDEVCS